MAKMIENKEKVEMKVMACVNYMREPEELLKKLRQDYFVGQDAYLTEDSFSLIGEWFNTITSVNHLKHLISAAAEDHTTIIFIDEVSIADPTFSSFQYIPDNIHLICCLSPTQGKIYIVLTWQ